MLQQPRQLLRHVNSLHFRWRFRNGRGRSHQQPRRHQVRPLLIANLLGFLLKPKLRQRAMRKNAAMEVLKKTEKFPQSESFETK